MKYNKIMDGMIGNNKENRNLHLNTAIIGFRHWFIKKDFLISPYNNFKWQPGTNLACCKRYDHPKQKQIYIKSGILGTSLAYNKIKVIPEKDCHCGLYSYLRLQHNNIYYNTIWGATLNWGIIEMHSIGMRAQYSLPILIYDNGHKDIPIISQKYNLKVVKDIHSLEQEASLLGQVAKNSTIKLEKASDYFN